MAGKVKTTGFARFFLIMIIVAPLAYIGASYYNGEDGIEKIKNLFKRGETTESAEGTKENTGGGGLFGGSSNLSRQIEELRAENEELRERLSEQEQEIQELKREVRLLRK
jgi:cell division protein FtsB